MGIFKKTSKDFDKPESVSKKCSKVIADGTTEKVNKNLKTKNLRV